VSWYGAQWVRVLALAAATAAAFVVNLLVHDPGPVYLVPILLAGVLFGREVGLSIGVLCAGLFAIVVTLDPPDQMEIGVFPATVIRLLIFGTVGWVVGWLAESRLSLEREVRRRDRELIELRAIQETLAPHEPEPRPGLELATCYLPAQDGVAGDFYLVTGGTNDSTVIAIGDVAGRGLDAAKRAWFVRTVLTSSADFTEDPGEMLDLANRSLIEESGISSQFVTVACLVFHPRDRSIRWSVAGHEPPITLDKAQPLTSRPVAGVPLGIDASTGCETAGSSLSFGSGLLLYTDGLIEARNGNGAGRGGLFGEERVRAIVSEMTGEAPGPLVERLRDAVLEHSGGRLADDLCIVALRASPVPESEAVCHPTALEAASDIS
jgi:serine phosphatase RsbU (regulator of sigma subunit)